MNRQVGVREFKYGVIDDPLLTGHVNQPNLDQKTAKKALTMAMLTCKLPLIVIVAPLKLYSEQANRGRGIQISGHRRPLIYRLEKGHVTYF